MSSKLKANTGIKLIRPVKHGSKYFRSIHAKSHDPLLVKFIAILCMLLHGGTLQTAYCRIRLNSLAQCFVSMSKWSSMQTSILIRLVMYPDPKHCSESSKLFMSLSWIIKTSSLRKLIILTFLIIKLGSRTFSETDSKYKTVFVNPNQICLKSIFKRYAW